MDMPQTNLKDYIIKCRQSGMPDSKITEALNSTGWPIDIIEKAKNEADSIVQAVSVVQAEQENPKENVEALQAINNNIGQKQEEITKNQIKKEKKQFSVFGLIAFLLSPIPLVGLAFCMIATDYIQKKKMSGIIFPILGTIVNVGIVVYIVWTIFMIILPGNVELEGFALALNNMFNFI